MSRRSYESERSDEEELYPESGPLLGLGKEEGEWADTRRPSHGIEEAEADIELERKIRPALDGERRRLNGKSFIWVASWSALIAFVVYIVFSLWGPFKLQHKQKDSLFNETLAAWDKNKTTKPLAVEQLAPYKFEPLPLGSIKPQGWMQDQLQLMAHGMAGHQYDFYHIVRHSPWLGGHSEYAALNEGFPYWLNGLVPLAYGLGDERLQGQVLESVEEVLRRQWKDGWLGPEAGRTRDIWARFPLCLGLMQLVQAEPTLSEKIVPALHKFVKQMHLMLMEGTAYWDQWGKVRYPDMLVTLQWLYEEYPQNNTAMLLDTMQLLQRHGFDWPGYWTNSSFIFADLDTIKPAISAKTFRFRHSHAVNVGQGLSAGAALYRFTKNESLLDVNRRGVDWTFSFHGDVAGSIIGDERESGLGPNRGSELCTASETLYSLSYLYHVIGDKEFADRCELAAFNAWPVSITADHWARQYLAAANEPSAERIYGHLNFWNSGFEALVYGLDTNYPCCTVNMPQGLPKFLSASFVRVGTDGIGHALLGPGFVNTTTQSGTLVMAKCDTNYPFGHTLAYTMHSSGPFTFHIRLPSWSEKGFTITMPGKDSPSLLSPDERTGMISLSLETGHHVIKYELKPSIRILPRGNSSIAIYHGALLYALDIGQTKSFRANHPSPNITYSRVDGPIEFPQEIKQVEIFNTKPWNIGIDPSTLHYHTTDSDETLKNPIFDYGAPPGYITGKGCPVHWPVKNGLPIALPALGEGATRRCSGEVTDVVLRPYASLKVHMAELPVVDLSGAGGE